MHKENPSECINGTPTAHHFLIGLCAFMVSYVSNLDWEPQNANNYSKMNNEFVSQPKRVLDVKKINKNITVSASLDFRFFSTSI